MDGFVLTATIKADSILAGTRLIVLTSMGQSIDSGQLRALGIEAYLVKPVKQSRLFDCLSQVQSKERSEENPGGPPSFKGSPATSCGTNPELKKTHILAPVDPRLSKEFARESFQPRSLRRKLCLVTLLTELLCRSLAASQMISPVEQI
jgi:two-component system, sensor histidine kinase and response regulator